MSDTDYNAKGLESDVVISSRIRLARNLREFPFPGRLDEEKGNIVLKSIRDVLINCKENEEFGLTFYDMESLYPVEKQLMVEKHIISPELSSRKTAGVLISKDEKVSIMINEEDHLRIQCIFPGMQLDKANELCNRIDDVLDKRFEYAFDPGYGYLTSCPTNIGTGIRASTMLHLPALTMSGYIKGVLEACGKLGIAVRGFYGEHTEALGDLYQISNQVTLGRNENEVISSIKNIAVQIIQRERALRTELHKKDPYRFEDAVYRAYGVLANARIISSEESLKLISRVRMGVNMGIIKDTENCMVDELIAIVQPAYLQKNAGKMLTPDERDALRAEILRKKIIQ